MTKYDYLIIGAGIVGLTIAHKLKQLNLKASICIIEKEHDIAQHASGRNSGVLHAGFYYPAGSLKAKFTVEGNQALKDFCQTHGLLLNECGKLVVVNNEQELEQLYELEKRGKANGSRVSLVTEKEAMAIEPNVKTYKFALHSPITASVDPKEVCQTLKELLVDQGVEFYFNTRYLGKKPGAISTNNGFIAADKIINCAGLYADKIAHEYGFGKRYTIIPFKGLYLSYAKDTTSINTHIYPVPNLKYPFLGVHYTKTAHNKIKIGPTAIPAFWRENYSFTRNFKPKELAQILYYEAQLFLRNSFGFRDLAFEEIKKYNKQYFIGLAEQMVQSIDKKGFGDFLKPGIRAQLLDKQTHKLLQDFVVEGDQHSIHVLNAVSPAFTCSFPFADYVVREYILD